MGPVDMTREVVGALVVRRTHSLERNSLEGVLEQNLNRSVAVVLRNMRDSAADTAPSRAPGGMTRVGGRKRKPEAEVDSGAAHIDHVIDPELEEEEPAVNRILELELELELGQHKKKSRKVVLALARDSLEAEVVVVEALDCMDLEEELDLGEDKGWHWEQNPIHLEGEETEPEAVHSGSLQGHHLWNEYFQGPLRGCLAYVWMLAADGRLRRHWVEDRSVTVGQNNQTLANRVWDSTDGVYIKQVEDICDLLWVFPDGLRTGIGEVVLAAAVEAAAPTLRGIKARRSVRHDGANIKVYVEAVGEARRALLVRLTC